MGVVRFLLILVVLLWLARLLWRWLRPVAPPAAEPGEQPAQALSRCSRCGTLIPHDRAVWRGERPYCGLACMDVGGV